MSVVLKEPRLLTAADLAKMPPELPSGPVLYELDNGRLVIMAPPGGIHGAIEANVAADLKNQGERRGLGKVHCGDVGIVLWRNPDRIVGADVLFVATASLPIRLSPEGYLETIPELVFEIRSKNDSLPEILAKVQDYLTAGVRAVCVADPSQRTVTVYRRDQEPQVLTDSDYVVLDDILPGVRLAVKDIFQI